jgi:hypothetical protein
MSMDGEQKTSQLIHFRMLDEARWPTARINPSGYRSLVSELIGAMSEARDPI